MFTADYNDFAMGCHVHAAQLIKDKFFKVVGLYSSIFS